MISFLKGRVEKLGPLEAHIDVNGVGYKIHITLSDSEKLALLGDSIVKLYTRTHYTETSRAMYGFLDETMADLYDFLIGLHGIGPRIVMSILLLPHSRFSQLPGTDSARRRQRAVRS